MIAEDAAMVSVPLISGLQTGSNVVRIVHTIVDGLSILHILRNGLSVMTNLDRS
jgi:hypothetical protein